MVFMWFDMVRRSGIRLLFLGICLVVFLCASSCVTQTQVTIESSPPDAEVYLNDRPVGKTPVTVVLGNEAWQEYRLELRKEGYAVLTRLLMKEVKTTNVIGGIFLTLPFLWVYGPQSYYRFVLDQR
jgi:hypothetical protein